MRFGTRKHVDRSGEAFQADLMGNLVSGADGSVWGDLSVSGIWASLGTRLRMPIQGHTFGERTQAQISSQFIVELADVPVRYRSRQSRL